MAAAVFSPMLPAATGMQLRKNKDGELDSYGSSGVMTLYPSPAAGRGSRRFLLCHVIVHVTSLILSIAFIAQTGEHSQSNQIEGDYAASILSMLFLLVRIAHAPHLRPICAPFAPPHHLGTRRTHRSAGHAPCVTGGHRGHHRRLPRVQEPL